MSAESFEFDLRYLPGGLPDEPRPSIRSLGRLARQYAAEGIPPVPMPTVGLVEGIELPLFYPGLNGISGPAGTGKSNLTKFFVRQQARAGNDGIVMDCETSEGEYTATLMQDFGMTPDELERVHYVTDVPAQGRTPQRDCWSGKALENLELQPWFRPSYVIADSQSKSMAVQGLDENRPIDCTQWYMQIEAIRDAFPEAAIVLIQGRQKGWHVGQDVRQGRGSSAQLHEVTSQFMVWPNKRGSREVEGLVDVVCTKDRYGHRVEGSKAAAWKYGPSGFRLERPEVEVEVPREKIAAALVEYLEDKHRDPELTKLPPKRDHVIENVAKSLSGSVDAVAKEMDRLVEEGKVLAHKVAQPGKAGPRPERVWSASDTVTWTWD